MKNIDPIMNKLITEYDFNKGELIEIAKKLHPAIFILGHVYNMNSIIDRLTEYGFNKKELEETLRGNIEAFTRGQVKRMNNTIEKLETLGFSSKEIKEAIRRSTWTFTVIKNNIETLVKNIEEIRKKCAQALAE